MLRRAVLCRLAESARRAEVARQEAAAKAAEYEKAAMEELEQLRAKRAAAKKVGTTCSCASVRTFALECHLSQEQSSEIIGKCMQGVLICCVSNAGVLYCSEVDDYTRGSKSTHLSQQDNCIRSRVRYTSHFSFVCHPATHQDSVCAARHEQQSTGQKPEPPHSIVSHNTQPKRTITHPHSQRRVLLLAAPARG